MTLIKRFMCLVGLGAIVAASTSCTPLGYSGESMYRRGIRSICIPMPTRAKQVYRYDNEQRLQRAIINRVEAQTQYDVTSREKADTLLTCEILQISQATTSFNPDTGRPRETQLTITIKFKWEDLRTGNTLVKEDQMTVANTYLPSDPFRDDFFRGSEDLLDKIAMRIVEKMQVGW